MSTRARLFVRRTRGARENYTVAISVSDEGSSGDQEAPMLQARHELGEASAGALLFVCSRYPLPPSQGFQARHARHWQEGYTSYPYCK